MTVEGLTPDLEVRATWRPEQFNRVTNPGFETNTTGWSVSAGINAAATSITRITTDAYAGTACGSLVTTAVSGSGVNFDLGSDRYFSDASHSTLYVARVALKRVSGGRRARITLGSLGTAADRATLDIADLSDQWREYAVAWRPTANRTDAELAITTGDDVAVTLLIDEVYVYSPLASQVENGSFLTDTTGWTASTGGVTLTRTTSTPFVPDGAYLRIDTTAGVTGNDGFYYLLGTRTFTAGRTYRLRFAMRVSSGNATPTAYLGVSGGEVGAAVLALTADWAWQTVDWTVAVTATGAGGALLVYIEEGGDGSAVWDMSEVEVYEALDEIPVRDMDVTRGAMSGGDETPAGTLTCDFADGDGTYDPRNTASDLYPSVAPGVALYARATYDGQAYGLAWGRITSIEHDPYAESTSISAGDGLGELEEAEVEREFTASLSYAGARAAALADAIGARQVDLAESGPEAGTFFDGTDQATPLLAYLGALDAATGTLSISEPSPHCNVGWVYRTIDRATLTDDEVALVIDDDSRGPLPSIPVSDEALVTAARIPWQSYEQVLSPQTSDGTDVALPWGDEPADLGVSVIAIGADPLAWPTEVPYMRYTREAFGSTDTPEPEEVFTVEKIVRVDSRGKVKRSERRTRSLRWDEPIFPMTIPAGETRELVVDFISPMGEPFISLDSTGVTASSTASPGRLTATLAAGTAAGTVTGLAVLAAACLPVQGEAYERSAAAVTMPREVRVEDTYVAGPGQAEGLARYRIWRHESPRIRPVVMDGLEPERQLGTRIGDRCTLTVTKYRIAAMPTVVRGVRHVLARPVPWRTYYALEELPDEGDWVTIDGDAADGIDSSAVLAH